MFSDKIFIFLYLDRLSFIQFSSFTFYGLRSFRIDKTSKVFETLEVSAKDHSIFKNRAFTATITVLSDIKIAPTAGLKITPQANNTPAAKGMAPIL